MGSADIDDDLVCDVTEILIILWARLCGERAGAGRAERAVAAAAAPADHEAV